jgi:hypothetical protein
MNGEILKLLVFAWLSSSADLPGPSGFIVKRRRHHLVSGFDLDQNNREFLQSGRNGLRMGLAKGLFSQRSILGRNSQKKCSQCRGLDLSQKRRSCISHK